MAGCKWIFIFYSLVFSNPLEYDDSRSENLDAYYQSGLDFTNLERIRMRRHRSKKYLKIIGNHQNYITI